VVTNVGGLRSRTAAFLTGSINPDGGFPGFRGGPSDPTMTALVIGALLEAGIDISAVKAARDYLQGTQLANGSWANDAYTTALAARILGDAKPDLAVESLALSSAAVQQGSPVQATVTVRNIGLGPSPATTLALFRGDPNAGGVTLGSVALSALQVGATFTHTFSVDTASASGTVALFAVADPAGQVAEYAETNNRQVALLVIRPFGQLPPPSDNQEPIITNVAPQSVISGTVYMHAVEAIDPEGQPLTFGLTFFDGQLAPQGMVIDAGSGLITWTAGVPGLYTFSITARDPGGASGFQVVSLQVIRPGEKRPPVFETFPLVAAAPGLLYSYHVSVRDPDGGPVTLRLAAAPTGMTLDPDTTTIRWTPAATDIGEKIVRLVATDDDQTSAEQQWKVIVDGGTVQAVDLVAMRIDPSLRRTDQQTLAVSGSVLVEVANQGTKEVGQFQVAIYEDRDGKTGVSADDAVLGQATVGHLASGERIELTVPLAGTGLFADNRLALAVDPDGAIKELRKDNNILTMGRDRQVISVPGSFSPVLKLDHRGISQSDPYINVGLSSTYVVAQLNDDNGDGHAGDGDIPDLLFLVYGGGNQRLRALNGRTGQLLFQSPLAFAEGAPLSVGDVDRDGFPEIFTTLADGSLAALKHDGTLLWSVRVPRGGNISLADMDGDGVSEIVIGVSIVNANGTIRCSGPETLYAGTATVADLDLDGKPEILSGQDVFRSDCSLWYSRATAVDPAQRTYNVVAQLDDDPYPEVVAVVGGYETQVVEHDGQLKWRIPVSPVLGSATVGDLDGDGWPEIVVSGSNDIRVFDRNGTLRWTHQNNDFTPRTEVFSLADLDGDGRLEAILIDGKHFYIINGRLHRTMT
jgi:hypothetical protein